MTAPAAVAEGVEVSAYAEARNVAQPQPSDEGISASDFWAVLPEHKYMYVPTRDLWPAASVDAKLMPAGRKAIDADRSVVQMTWHPGYELIIEDCIVADGGWVAHPGVRVLNMYRPAPTIDGDAAQAGPWLDHLRAIYPEDAAHIIKWLAQRVQNPGEKINHALVLGGAQGIGKDTILEPVKYGVGAWNMAEISPGQVLGRFNGWVKAVVARISEARDLGDVDRFAFYDHCKTYIAAPPDVIRVDEKNLREHPVFNVVGIIITTNHKTDGLYLPADDRRHYVAWSDSTKDDFTPEGWRTLWQWYEAGGIGHVVAYLRSFDLSSFDPKAAPPKTPAFHAMVAANASPEDAELLDVIESVSSPDVLTIRTLAHGARLLGLNTMADEFETSKARRALPHKLERAGYVPVRNPDAADGLHKVHGRRQVVYARRDLTIADQCRAVGLLLRGQCGQRSQ